MWLLENMTFPDPNQATEDGLVAIGGDLSSQRLLHAYHSGIFPWYTEGEPILWWSPNPRMVLFPEQFKVSKSLRKTIRSGKFTVTWNTSFKNVIHACASIERKGQKGTWITSAMIEAYCRLNAENHAVSVEVWEQDRLVGGLYGIDLKDKKIFCGESMFSLVSDASKVAFYFLVHYALKNNYHLIDCQVYNAHTASLGAVEISRQEFIDYLK